MYEMKEKGREWVVYMVLCKQIKAFQESFYGQLKLYRRARDREYKASRIAKNFFRRIKKHGFNEDVRQIRVMKK
jgi:hypothetical protein